MKNIFMIFGTRPEAIKMVPLIKTFHNLKDYNAIICLTAQHREMLDSVLTQFEIEADFDLNLMSHGQTITDITSKVLNGAGRIIKDVKPDLIMVHGDTTTTLAASLAGFYHKTPVGHVEAGLRSGNIYSPYPEEMNRILTDSIASIHFAPTEGNRLNLLNSGIKDNTIYITGNTVIDTLFMVIKDNYKFNDSRLNEIIKSNDKIILMTSHRRENLGHTMIDIFAAVKTIAHRNPEIIIIFPYHLNPDIKQVAEDILGSIPNVLLIPPLDYVEFANLMAHSYLVLTDSGGIQEEAPSLGKPVIVIRKETERPEAVKAGTVKVVGTKKQDIIREVEILLKNTKKYEQMAKAVNPYGDGKAAEKIVSALNNWFKGNDNIIS